MKVLAFGILLSVACRCVGAVLLEASPIRDAVGVPSAPEGGAGGAESEGADTLFETDKNVIYNSLDGDPCEAGPNFDPLDCWLYKVSALLANVPASAATRPLQTLISHPPFPFLP